MNTLYHFLETFTNGFRIEFLDILSLAAILCGILVIISKNPIVSVLFLIGLFLSISSYLIILGLTFIGLSYLLVYVGAVSILFLFILMLINVRISELVSNTNNIIPLAIIIIILFYFSVNVILPHITVSFNIFYPNIEENFSINAILPHSTVTFNIFYPNIVEFLYDLSINNNNYFTCEINNYIYGQSHLQPNSCDIRVCSKRWEDKLSENSHITSIGNIMYTSYSIWLIITSIILLLAMVGAIIITIK